MLTIREKSCGQSSDLLEGKKCGEVARAAGRQQTAHRNRQASCFCLIGVNRRLSAADRLFQHTYAPAIIAQQTIALQTELHRPNAL